MCMKRLCDVLIESFNESKYESMLSMALLGGLYGKELCVCVYMYMYIY